MPNWYRRWDEIKSEVERRMAEDDHSYIKPKPIYWQINASFPGEKKLVGMIGMDWPFETRESVHPVYARGILPGQSLKWGIAADDVDNAYVVAQTVFGTVPSEECFKAAREWQAHLIASFQEKMLAAGYRATVNK